MLYLEKRVAFYDKNYWLARALHDERVLDAYDYLTKNSVEDFKKKFTSLQILVIDENELPHYAKLFSEINSLQRIVILKKKISEKTKAHLLLLNKPTLLMDATAPDESLLWDLLAQIEQDLQAEQLKSMQQSFTLQEQNELIKFEEEIKQKQSLLNNKRLKLIENNNRLELLRKVLFELYSVNPEATEYSQELEKKLNEMLPSQASTYWIKIAPSEKVEQLKIDLESHQFKTFEIFDKDQTAIMFAFTTSKLTSSEFQFYEKIADSVQFLIAKKKAQNELKQLQQLVEKAIQSLNSPALVVNKNYEVFESFGFQNEFETGSLCYQKFFNRQAPCENCSLGQKFNLQDRQPQLTNEYEVFSQKINTSEDSQQKWFNLYVDKTEEKLIEQKLTQSAKLKELGLISSSIAHELNNPLGGIISYLQILQMELAPTHHLRPDLELMSQAADRMKKIIENLLVFSRKPSSLTHELYQLNNVVSEVLQLMELQFKVENVKVIFNSDTTAQVLLAKDVFRDSLQLIFNFFIEGFRQKMPAKSALSGLVEVKISQDQINFYLEVQGNIGPLQNEQKTKNITLLTIDKSLIDQGFRVELTEPNPLWVAMKVTLPKSRN